MARAIVPVALCAGFVSGSCTASWVGGLDIGAGVAAALIAAGIALAVGTLFLIITRDRRELRFYAVIGVSACIAAEFGAFWPFLWPAIVAILIAIAGGILAGRIARNAFPVRAIRAAYAGIISAIAIAIAMAGVVAGFWLNLDFGGSFSFGCCADGGSTKINHFAFVPIAGAVPPLMSAIGAWLAGVACRRELPIADSGSDNTGAGQR